MRPPRILLYERRPAVAGLLASDVPPGARLLYTSEVSHLSDLLASFAPDIVVTAGVDAQSAANRVRSLSDSVVLVVVTDTDISGNASTGADLCLRTPITPAEFAATLARLAPSNGKCSDPTNGQTSGLIGCSRVFREVLTKALAVAAFNTTVLITGETGTGKELIAEKIHAQSERSAGPFISLNSTAIPESLLESELFGHERGAFTGAVGAHSGKLGLAQHGTIFFDEIGDMSLAAQAKLLRALDSKQIYRLGGTKPIPIDVRVVAATNHDLENAVREMRFRKDLFYRLNVVRIEVPPLRERSEDIPLLILHYVSHFNSLFRRTIEGFSSDAVAAMVAYDWPGNVRELKNMIESIFVSTAANKVETCHLPELLRNGTTRTSASEKHRVLCALESADWNKTRAAEQLHCSRMTVYRKMAKYSVERDGAARKPLGRQRAG